MKHIFQMILSLNLMVTVGIYAQNKAILDNGLIRREINLEGNHISSDSYTMYSEKDNFIKSKADEFSFLVNDIRFTGLSNWSNVAQRDTVAPNGGKGIIISFDNLENNHFSVDAVYMVYPALPVVHKSLKIRNTGAGELKLEAVDVEFLQTGWPALESYILRHYGRNKCFEPFVGDHNDPLVVIHDIYGAKGFAVGNEAVSMTKRTSFLLDGKSFTTGLTHPDQDFGFRKWLKSGEQWESPWVFTALYNKTNDPQWVINTTVSDFVRKYMGIRLEELPDKPMFAYNTWFPFYRGINEKLVMELAKAASECGVEEFIIDDGWQINIDDPEGKRGFHGDWEVDKKKFPNGLKPVFDYIKSLGMKPGLWVTVSSSDPSSKVYKDHPEYFVVDKNGKLANLHVDYGESRTACLGTDWYDYIKSTVLRLVREHGLAYMKLDFAIVTSCYVYDKDRTGCHASNHPYHRDREESYAVIYNRCMQLLDDLHREAPDLFIDCTYETAGRQHLNDYGIVKHAEGNWLSNIQQPGPLGPLRMRNLAWGRCPAIPATSLLIGNLRMNDEYHQLAFKSLAGALPVMLGDPRALSTKEKAWYKSESDWLKELEQRHAYMSFRQDLPGFGEPAEGAWDAFSRINTETGSGGLIGVFRHGSKESSRLITVPWVHEDKTYQVLQGAGRKFVASLSGKDLIEKGFQVTLQKEYDGELFEIAEKK